MGRVNVEMKNWLFGVTACVFQKLPVVKVKCFLINHGGQTRLQLSSKLGSSHESNGKAVKKTKLSGAIKYASYGRGGGVRRIRRGPGENCPRNRCLFQRDGSEI